MTRLRTLLADDEPLARRGMERLLAREPDVEVVGSCRDGVETLRRIRELRPDLLLLDIQMPGLDGFEVLAALSAEERPVTIFVTAFDAHALQAFEVHAVDYVLKPIQPERLGAAIERARERVRAKEHGIGVTGEEIARLRELLASSGAGARYLERLLIRSAGSVSVVPVRDVRWLESDGDYVRVHGRGATELMRATLQSLEDRLDPRVFARIHRSYLVRLDEVREVRGSAGGDGTVLLSEGVELPLSRTHRDRLLGALDQR